MIVDRYPVSAEDEEKSDEEIVTFVYIQAKHSLHVSLLDMKAIIRVMVIVALVIYRQSIHSIKEFNK